MKSGHPPSIQILTTHCHPPASAHFPAYIDILEPWADRFHGSRNSYTGDRGGNSARLGDLNQRRNLCPCVSRWLEGHSVSGCSQAAGPILCHVHMCAHKLVVLHPCVIEKTVFGYKVSELPVPGLPPSPSFMSRVGKLRSRGKWLVCSHMAFPCACPQLDRPPPHLIGGKSSCSLLPPGGCD